MTKNRTLIIAALLIAAGCALKLHRYSHVPADDQASIAGKFDPLMARGGWEFAAERQTTPATLSIRSYRKAGCARQFFVVVLGASRGIEPLVRLNLGNDLAFVQDRRVLDRPDIASLKYRKAVHAMLSGIGIDTRAPEPILAVSPDPRALTGSCAPPQWASSGPASDPS